MNKTVNINLGGLPFIIDDVAYERLNEYLTSLERHFSTADASSYAEIMQDIEARVAEILSMRLNATKKIVTQPDVDEVIAIIGKPEEMGADGDAANPGTTGASNSANYQRRIYRDGDNATIGGVCAGLGAYFNIDPVWIRAVWAVSILIFGAGLLLYIILWAIIPEAKTPTQKLEMRGDQYDLDSIKRSFKEESTRFEKRMKDIANEYSSPEAKARYRNAGQNLYHSITPAAKQTANIIVKVILGFALFFVSTILVVMAVALFSNTSTFHIGDALPFETSVWGLINMFTERPGETNLIMTGIALVVLTPMVMLVYGIVKGLFGFKVNSKPVGIIAGSVFWIGVLICAWEGYLIYDRLDYKEKTTEIIPLPQPKGDTLSIETRLPVLGHNMVPVEMGDVDFLAQDDPVRVWPQIRLNIVTSDTDKFYLKLEKLARGKTPADALDNSENITVAHQVADSSAFVIDRYATLPIDAKYKNQRLTAVLYVPAGKYITIGKGARKILKGCANLQDMRPHKMAGHTWKMETAGLSCVDCPPSDRNNSKDDNW